jgi:RNA polymerase sigma factor (sigma-70 family)
MPVKEVNLLQPKPDTTSLVHRCLRGDAAAWSLLIERYARLVHAIPVRHGLSPQEVDDVGQDVFLALAQNLHTIEDPERLPGWLVTTARRMTWRAIQRRRAEEPLDDGGLDDPAAATPLIAPAPTASDLLETWHRQEMLAKAMERLQPRCHQLLMLLFLADAEPSYDEISAQIGIPKGSIGPTRNRCLQQLRSILEGLSIDDPD